jgi:thiamine pyrophosphokinase
MNIVIFTGGEFAKSTLTQKALQEADMILAADSGAEYAIKLGISLSAVVGDFDSLSPTLKKQLEAKGTKMIEYKMEKDETDTELAVQYAVQQGAKKITLLGGNSGNRFDHVIANLLLTTAVDVPIHFVNGNQISWVEKGPAKVELQGKKGDLLSLIPLAGDVEGISSKNLHYPLTDDTLEFGKPRGISNVFTGDSAEVSFAKGILLFVHTHV